MFYLFYDYILFHYQYNSLIQEKKTLSKTVGRKLIRKALSLPLEIRSIERARSLKIESIDRALSLKIGSIDRTLPLEIGSIDRALSLKIGSLGRALSLEIGLSHSPKWTVLL